MLFYWADFYKGYENISNKLFLNNNPYISIIKTMAKKLLLVAFALTFASKALFSQAFIYVHQKNINEESSVDFNFSLLNSSGTSLNTWKFNDQANSDNVSLSGNHLYVYDIGVGHGTGGDGEMWAIANSSGANISNTGGAAGTIYHRSPASSTWSAITSITTATSIDGAYANQFVYSTSGGVYFYYNGSVTTLYTSGNTVTDVTANNGRIAVVANGVIYLYNSSYTATSAPAANGSWTTLYNTGNTGSRIDMNVGATLVAYTIPGSNAINTVNFSGTTASLGSAGTGATGSTADIAYDDKNNVYTTCSDNSNGGTDVVASYNGSAWTTETSARKVMRLTGGAGKQVYGVEYLGRTGLAQPIWYRAVDNTGTAYWIDDERIRSSSSLAGNGIIIPVTSAGTYTVQETLPTTSWDLGRFNLYDPAGASTANVSSNSATVVIGSSAITNGEVVYVEFVNEKLNPKAISLTCTTQTLQSFDPVDFGSATYGTPVEGTAYHDYPGSTPEDGYYFVVKAFSGNWYSSPGITDHTGNGGYFLVVNAAYTKDEFYRQRVTNLVPGLQYTISFYAANVSSGSPIAPNVLYGLQDLSGNIVNSVISGTFATDNNWHYYSFTFTATTSTADLFLRNQTIGGNGNDIALDDIALNPVITPLPSITVLPAIAPNVCIGTAYTFSNSQSGGIWTSSPSANATINPKTGIASGIAAGNAIITYTYTNAIGCVSTASTGIIVSAPPTITASDILGGTVCLTQTDSLKSSPGGGTLPYTYAWTSSGTGNGLGTANIPSTTATPTAAGSFTYTIKVTDAVGCSATAAVALNVSSNTPPTVTATATTSPFCTNKSITLNSSATGGTGPYAYTWSATPTGNGLGATGTQNTNATPTAAGTYSYEIFVVDNGTNCRVAKFVSATVNTSPTVTVAGPTGTQQLCNNSSYAITSSPAGGSGSYTYAWTASKVSGNDNNAGLQSPVNQQNVIAKPTLTLSVLGTPDVYNYAVTVTDGNGCTATANTNVTAYLNALAAAPSVSVSTPSSNQTLCSGSTISLTASASVGAGGSGLTYSWTGPGSYTSASLSPGTVTPSASGVYTIKATQSNGCSASATSPSITVNPSVSVAASSYAPSLCSGSTATLDSVYAVASAGTSPYTYSWASSGGMSVSAPSSASSAVTGGSTGNTYTFTITLTDAKNCTATATTTVARKSSSGPSVSGMASAATICINTATAYSPTVTAGSSSSLTYLWTASPSTGAGLGATSTSNTTATPTVAGSYIYTIKVTDGNGCAVSASTGAQTVNAALAVSVASSAPGFCGSGGSINLSAITTGGSGTYNSYVWTTGVITSPGSTTVSPTSSTTTNVTTATISAATVGTSQFQYTAAVTDSKGCIGTGSSAVLVVGSTITLITPTASIGTPCVGQQFTLTGTFSGGTSPYSYTWTPPSHSAVTTASGSTSSSPIATTATDSTAGNYAFGLVLIDKNNCTVSGTTPIKAINDTPAVTLAANRYNPCANPAATINLTATLTTATVSPYTYAWTGSGVVNNTSGATTTATPTASGPYTVKITDANLCASTAYSPTVTLDQATPSISISCGTNGSGQKYAQLFESNGTTWYWTPPAGARFYTSSILSTGSDSDISHLQAPFITKNGIYNVQITNSNGCIGSGPYNVTGSCSIVLATNMLSFTASAQGQKALLSWTAATEANADRFVVERSSDGTNFEQLGTLYTTQNGTAGIQYSYADEHPVTGLNYYRLKLVDKNGAYSYSAVRTVSFSGMFIVQLYPNPASSYLVLDFNSDKEEKSFIFIETAQGSRVFTNGQTIVKGANRIVVNQIANLAQGGYFITLQTATKTYRAKFIKGDK